MPRRGGSSRFWSWSFQSQTIEADPANWSLGGKHFTLGSIERVTSQGKEPTSNQAGRFRSLLWMNQRISRFSQRLEHPLSSRPTSAAAPGRIERTDQRLFAFPLAGKKWSCSKSHWWWAWRCLGFPSIGGAGFGARWGESPRDVTGRRIRVLAAGRGDLRPETPAEKPASDAPGGQETEHRRDDSTRETVVPEGRIAGPGRIGWNESLPMKRGASTF